MEAFLELIGRISGWIWGPPMLALLGLGGLFLTIRLKFLQFRYAPYILKQTFGKMFSKSTSGAGTVTPFQAVTSALASTVGAANIVGVPVAIMFGGPGAVFWMWVMAFIGMGSKFTEVVLGFKYRERDEVGEYVGGPMYYMTKGLNMKWLGIIFSFSLMIEISPSIMVQANSVASSALETFGLPTWIAGVITLIVVGIVVIGGIKRIGKVAEKLVPFMASLYVLGCLVIVILNITKVPEVLLLIVQHAFQPIAAAGGFAGATIAAALRWGLARGVYSNEAGMGTAPIAHSASTNDHPVRQGFWAIFECIVDTLIICSATAFVILSSDVWLGAGAMDNAPALPAAAFDHYFGIAGSSLVTLSLLMFVISTLIVITWYGEKQAEFLFGLKFARVMRYVYLVSIIVGAIGVAKFLWQFLDILLAMIVIPNMIAILLLHKDVIALVQEFFTSKQFYLKDTGKVSADEVI